jgi:hypothetical protein
MEISDVGAASLLGLVTLVSAGVSSIINAVSSFIMWRLQARDARLLRQEERTYSHTVSDRAEQENKRAQLHNERVALTKELTAAAADWLATCELVAMHEFGPRNGAYTEKDLQELARAQSARILEREHQEWKTRSLAGRVADVAIGEAADEFLDATVDFRTTGLDAGRKTSRHNVAREKLLALVEAIESWRTKSAGDNSPPVSKV